MGIPSQSLAIAVLSALGILACRVSGSPSMLKSDRFRSNMVTKPSILSTMEDRHAYRRDAHDLKNSVAVYESPANGEECGLDYEEQDGDESINHGHGRLPCQPNRLLLSRGGALPRNKKSPITVASHPSISVELLMERLKIGFYFALWYVLNVMYNIMNKKLMNIIPAPLTLGTIQLFIGGAYAVALWAFRIRAAPQLTPKGRVICRSVGFYHGAGQLASMVSMGAGPISFTHIVKALEPFFSAVCSALIFGHWFPWQVYTTLIPVVGGVGYACMKEPHFSLLAFLTAMGSNLAFALRAVVSKRAMTTYIGDNISSTNLFGVVTLYSAFLMAPLALLTEKFAFIALWKTAVTSSGKSQHELVRAVLVSGLFHYLNNEVMYLALGNVHPVTLAVGNTMKRVFILIASVLVFRNPVTLQAAIGSAVGISGVLLYSLVKAHYEKLDQNLGR